MTPFEHTQTHYFFDALCSFFFIVVSFLFASTWSDSKGHTHIRHEFALFLDITHPTTRSHTYVTYTYIIECTCYAAVGRHDVLFVGNIE